MARVLLIDDDQSNLDFMRRGATEVVAEPLDLEQLRSAIRHSLGQEPR